MWGGSLSQRRCGLFAKARKNLLDDDHWTLAQTLFGITTYYRTEKNGSLSVKLEGQLEGVSLFDQVAVLREVDLHYKWAPFCSSSLTVAHLNKLDTVGWFVVGIPTFGLIRDSCFRAIGCDSMLEDGSILLVAQGINDRQKTKNSAEHKMSAEEEEELKEFEYLSKDPILDTLELPDPPTRLGSGRLTLRTFQSLIQVESPTSARTRIIANVDPNLPFVPHSLLDFIMKKLCGVLLNKLQQAAKRISKDPINNAHAAKMRQEELFYKSWLLPKFQAVCKLRQWTMPSISSFDLSDQQMEIAQEADAKKLKSKKAKSVRFYHSLSDERLGEFLEHDSGRASAPANIGGRVARVRTLTDDSVVSDISRNSSSVLSIWQKNPISSYLREVEEKTQLRKSREIEHSRERAAHRLKPKPLDDDAQSRLAELRLARHRRETGTLSETNLEQQVPRNSETPSTQIVNESQKKDIAALLAGHGALPRLAVMTALVSSLFIFLSLGSWIEDWLANRITLTNPAYGRHVGAVVYILVSGLLHFATSYVSLMYAFSALKIGSMAGREALRFYSQNIHVILGTFTSSMIAIGVIKASVISLLRWFIWRSTVLAGVLTAQLGPLQQWIIDSLPDEATSAIEVLAGLAYQGLLFTAGIVMAGLRLLWAVIIESNIIGQSLWKALHPFFDSFAMGWNAASMFGHSSLAAYDGSMDLPTWRDDVRSSIRFLLSYSGIFLVAVVLMFILFARSSRSYPSKDTKSDELESDYSPGLREASDYAPELQSSMISSPDSAGHTLRSGTRSLSLSHTFETIHESSEELHDANRPSQEKKKDPELKKLVRRVTEGTRESVGIDKGTSTAVSI